jgi:dihydrofolate reductase
MRKIISNTFITMDGVMQGPGGPEEDPTQGFQFGGWGAPYFDEAMLKSMVAFMSRPMDILVGRITYEIFAAHWPYAPEEDPIAQAQNKATKYVVSNRPIDTSWKTTAVIRDNVVEAIRKLKEEDGPEIQVHGSGKLIQSLLKHDLIDVMRIFTFPITLGKGKRLFAAGTLPAAFTLTYSEVSTTGVIMATYERAGEVKTGSFEFETPTEAEIARRKRLADEEKAEIKN